MYKIDVNYYNNKRLYKFNNNRQQAFDHQEIERLK